ncbi:MAG: peptidylprolyl isomerase [Deltaproteobacteria bacterium]|nr:peptidylprolyl isomerase [Deltaproteobacteria bacterium]
MVLFGVLGLGLGACKAEEQPKSPAGAANPGAPSDAALALLDPAKANQTAPERFTIKLETTKGEVLIDVDRNLAPLGADRIYNLVKLGYYDDVAFFRVIGGFMAQVGIHGTPSVNAKWRDARIQDDPVKASNTPGMVSFATGGPNTRTTQFFINFGDNSRLDGMGFSPIGKVRDMTVMNQIYSGYGEGAPGGRGPSQGLIQSRGNEYLRAEFPELDYIKKATIAQ